MRKQLRLWVGALGLAIMMSVAPAQADILLRNPYDVKIDIEATCDHRDAVTGVLEPIHSFWYGDYEGGSFEPRVTFFVLDTEGNSLGAVEMAALPTPGWHDNWMEYITEPIDYTYTVYVVIDETIVSHTTVNCEPEREPVAGSSKPQQEPTPAPKIRLVRLSPFPRPI